MHELSARAVRLYQMRLLVTVGFRVLQHAHRPHPGLAACSCSYGRAFATDFFRAERLTAPALSFATVVVTASGHFVSSDEFMPMPGTLGRVSDRRTPVRDWRYGGIRARCHRQPGDAPPPARADVPGSKRIDAARVVGAIQRIRQERLFVASRSGRLPRMECAWDENRVPPGGGLTGR